jgi:hypothetical protein
VPPVREPILATVAIRDLRPTQITVGYREVEHMRARWRGRSQLAEAKFLGRHMIPVVAGPKHRNYIIDHHHLCRALHDDGQADVLVTVVANLSELEPKEFWFALDNRGWMHPFDEDGKRRNHGHIPKAVSELRDDPFRSLAGELRRAGGFAKDTTPFSEFLWADFLRHRIKRSEVTEKFPQALKHALKLAKSMEADYLPGWCGPIDS